ncbi:hypothetical protein FQN51_003323 [Onygenales sp. PD_10]|nr:hypothetical protein FQN51_003323 [Onygenales sp. PD_10]
MTEKPGDDVARHPDMTIDEMMAKFPKANVNMAMFDRHYIETKKALVAEYEECIAEGCSVEYFQKSIQELPPAPPIDPSEPKDLDPDVLWRIRVLKYQLRPSAEDDQMRVNIDAILDAYRKGKLNKVNDELTTVWYAGHMIMGPLPTDDPMLEKLGTLVPELEEKYGPGDLWTEDTRVYIQRKMITQSFVPSHTSHMHTYSIRIRAIGATDFRTFGPFLDDTGSEFLELYRDDVRDLHIPQGYAHHMANVHLETANGQVMRRSILVEIQLVVNGAPLEKIMRVRATITPGNAGIQQRCSGMFLRQNFYTATCPDGNGILYISDKKTGIVSQLPAI